LPIPDGDLIELEKDSGSTIKNLASARLGIQREEIVTCKGTIGHGVRFDGQSTSLVSEPVLQAGYCGVLALENVDDNACLTLARKEVEIPGNAGWYGFVYVNHPVHASTLTDEG
nr:hypothetical protein [Candidatus Sigynarchaeota archaeon]